MHENCDNNEPSNRTKYTYGLQRISQEQLVSSTWTLSFYGYDGGGNVRQLTNAAGAMTDTYDYDAFGNAVSTSGSTPNEFLYRGEQFDSDLGLYYLRARYYNPLTGRFMGRDPKDGTPADPQSLHKYLYAGGDPVNGIDPMGREDMFEYRPLTPEPVVEEAGVEVGEELEEAAEELDPCQGHHIVPKFLGGPKKQPLAWIPRSYHQVVTNAFRTVAGSTGPGYGYNYRSNGLPGADELKQILRNVYNENPLSDAIEECLE